MITMQTILPTVIQLAGASSTPTTGILPMLRNMTFPTLPESLQLRGLKSDCVHSTTGADQGFHTCLASQVARKRSAAFSPTSIDGALVLPDGIVGKIEASAIRSPERP